jgi:multidrug efflux pump subunit AcrB
VSWCDGVECSAWSIRRPLPAIVLSIILLFLGWTSFTKLAVTRLPNADIPLVSVVVTQFGAAPAELEAQVTKTIEDGISGVEGVRHISSSIADGVSVTTITFRLETNTERALNDVKDAVTRTSANLPEGGDEGLKQRVGVGGRRMVNYEKIAPARRPSSSPTLSMTSSSAPCRACAASPRWSASAAPIEKYWSRSIPIGCRRSA